MKKSMVKRFISILLVLVMICCCCISASAYQEGVNKVQVNNWGVEVYVCKTAINVASIGVNIGAVFIPIPILQAAVIGLGSAMGICPGGIVLEYHYGWMALKMLNPVARLTLSHPTKVRWQ